MNDLQHQLGDAYAVALRLRNQLDMASCTTDSDEVRELYHIADELAFRIGDQIAAPAS